MDMETKPVKAIMYGVTDFALMRNPKRPAYLVDHTEFIRELEQTRYAMFLRPRRFGKSLLCAILQAYYDVDYADRFEELFGDLKIGRNPTDERGQYCVLMFDFSAVAKNPRDVQDDFNAYCCECIDAFVDHYHCAIPEEVAEAVKAKTSASQKLFTLAVRLKKPA